MQRSILIYGAISGFIIIVTNTISLEIGHGDVWLGFLVMFIAFSMIFVAIKQHRDATLGGVISLTGQELADLAAFAHDAEEQ